MKQIKEAQNQLQDGHVHIGLDMLEQALKSANDEEKFTISQVYYDYGFYDEGIAVLEELLKKYPTESQLIVRLAEMYIELENDSVAVELLTEIKQDDSYYLQALLHLADLYQIQGLFEVSEQKLFEAKEIAPNEIVIDFALGELLFSIGQYQRALIFYENVLKQTSELNGIDIRNRLAEVHALLGHYEKALSLYEALDSENPDILFKHGYIARQLKRHDISIKVWEKLQKIDPEYYSVYFELGSVLKEEGRIKEAYEIVKTGLEHDEFDKELFYLAAQLSLNLAEFNKSLTYIQKAISLDHDYKDAILLLVYLYKQGEQYEKIIQLITDIKESGSEDPIYNWELARAYEQIENYPLARKLYDEAYHFLSDDSKFLKEYGYFLVEEGEMKLATHVFKKYLKLEPNDVEMTEYFERLLF